MLYNNRWQNRKIKTWGIRINKKVIAACFIILSDAFTIFISFVAAYAIRSHILPHLYLGFRTVPIPPFLNYLEYFYMILVWIFVFAYEKLYIKHYPYWEEVKILTKSNTLAFALALISIFISRLLFKFSRTIFVVAWLVSLVLLPVSRYLIKRLMQRLRLWEKKLIIVGVQQTSLSIASYIQGSKTLGYEVLGFLDDDPHKQGKVFHGAKVLGKISDLNKISQQFRSKDIMIATPHLPRKKLKELITACEEISDSMWLIPRSGDIISEGVDLEVLGNILTLSIKKNLAKPWNILLKDLFDRSLSFLLIVTSFPLLISIAVAIVLDSRGPFFFTQNRTGKNGKAFRIYKFRSMFVDNAKRMADYLDNDTRAKEEWGKFRKIKNHDPRVTRVGRFIRRFSLDELPQLFNVFLGKMSLVGPRPYLFEELDGKDSFKKILARIKPGITGLWQISGRSEVPFDERVEIDEYYIRNWSLWFDVVILIKSVRVLFSSKGAY